MVDDDGPLAADLTTALSTAGINKCTVWHAESGADAREVLKRQHPDLIVLDLTLPDINGLVLCTQIKAEAPNVPFMVCGAATTTEKVLSFKLGAEDVVTRPYELPELEVRIEAILRRHAGPKGGDQVPPAQKPPAPARRVGKLLVDHSQWRVTLDNKPLDLTRTEFQLIAFLAERAGVIVSREQIARGVWGNESMACSRTIDAYVRRVGAKLEGPTAPRIVSIHGLGYQLIEPMAAR